MFHSQQHGRERWPVGSAPEPPLEDKLRSMILSNGAGFPPASEPLSSPIDAQPLSSQTVASQSPPMALPTAAAGAAHEPSPTSPSRPMKTPTSPKMGRKKLNQAQRRQMSAQLSIPIDPRPIQHQSAGSFAGPSGFGGHSHAYSQPNQFSHQYQNQYSQSQFPNQYPTHYSPNQYRQQQSQQSQQPQQPQQKQQQPQPPQQQRPYNHHYQQRPQSATHRPSHYGQGPIMHNSPANGGAYPTQPRHHQSLSYQGPAKHDDPYNWRSHQQQSQQQNQHPSAHSPFDAPSPRSTRPPSSSNNRMYNANMEDIQLQAAMLEHICEQIVASAEIEPADIEEKERFRAHIERVCQQALVKYELEVNGKADFPAQSVRLKCFGSLSSGFATKASDMDLGLISPLSDPQPEAPKSPIPRILEKALLDAGLGARLLARTRVPIIKLCQLPTKQLRADLLDERAKWEKGIVSDHDGLDVDENGTEESEQTPAHRTDDLHLHEDNTSKKPGHVRKESVPVVDSLDKTKYLQNLGSLKQPANQSLGNYYAMAKRLLRKLNARDITHSTAREFKEKDLKILTDVCHAFVAGLEDQELRARLWATRSLGTSATPSQLNYRSLYGVYMQIEGERLVMLWENREMREKDALHEDEARYKIKVWRDLQNKPAFAQDMLAYNKELQIAVENLRKILSIQVMTLEQGQFESAMQYHDRVSKLLNQCGGRDAAVNGNNNEVLPIIVKHYIAGIFQAEIRAEVEAFSRLLDKPSLRAVARRHKSLQLAAEFERALDKGCYDDDDSIEVVKAYMKVLRLPLEKGDLPGRRFDYVIPRNAATTAIIHRARQLTDPSKLAPNQPRDPYRDRLEFPKDGVGVQCDINFSAHLALQNTLLLRCYSHTDPRVRPLVLFVKHWAKVRGINTPYRGTLSSYGYVLMVLHYLVNVAQPFVCPNLQQLAQPTPEGASPGELGETVECRGHDVRFWRNEEEIMSLAQNKMLNKNNDSIGYLLRGFFEYYAQSNFMSTVPFRGFDWGRDVLSLRTPGGLRTKQEKRWTGARTVFVQDEAMTAAAMATAAAARTTTTTAATTATTTATAIAEPVPKDATGTVEPDSGDGTGPTASTSATTPTKGQKEAKIDVKEVKHRYLFAIEDPFELDHNVARTVTHSGIVAIRDEFRRGWRIIKNLGKGPVEENLLEDAADNKGRERDLFAELLTEIHGPELTLG